MATPTPTARIDACKRCGQDFQQPCDRGRPHQLCPACRRPTRRGPTVTVPADPQPAVTTPTPATPAASTIN